MRVNLIFLRLGALGDLRELSWGHPGGSLWGRYSENVPYGGSLLRQLGLKGRAGLELQE